MEVTSISGKSPRIPYQNGLVVVHAIDEEETHEGFGTATEQDLLLSEGRNDPSDVDVFVREIHESLGVRAFHRVCVQQRETRRVQRCVYFFPFP